jgi:hypothetical protein
LAFDDAAADAPPEPAETGPLLGGAFNPPESPTEQNVRCLDWSYQCYRSLF